MKQETNKKLGCLLPALMFRRLTRSHLMGALTAAGASPFYWWYRIQRWYSIKTRKTPLYFKAVRKIAKIEMAREIKQKLNPKRWKQ